MPTISENNEPENSNSNPFQDWGLIPKREANERFDIKTALHHFFVEFNPLYLISAFCIFYGVFLVANNIDLIDQASNISGQVILFFVLQAYEATIIAGIAFLVFKTKTIRPAVILCLLECALIFDCTFRLESLSQTGNMGIALFAAWVVLVLIKFWLIAKIMRLNMSWIHYACITATALSLAIIIELFSQTWINKSLLLQVSAWVGAFVLLALIVKRPNITSALAITKKDRETTEKCIQAGFTIVASFYFYHTLAFLFFAADPSVRAPSLIPQLASITLLFTIIKSKPSDIIKYAALTILVGLTAPIGTSYICCILALIVLYHALKNQHANYAILSVFLFYAAYWLAGWEILGSPIPPRPDTVSLQTGLLVLSLIAIGVIFKNAVALSLMGIALAYAAFNSIDSILPSSELGKGILIITSGFVLFLTGLAINWRLRLESSGHEIN